MGLCQCSQCSGSGIVLEPYILSINGDFKKRYTSCDQCHGSGMMACNSEYDDEGHLVNRNQTVSKAGFYETPKR
jgi:hypothetical protein